MHEPILLTLGTKEFRMVLSTPAICDFEEAVGKRIYDLQAPMRTIDLVALIWAAARRQSGKQLTRDHVMEALELKRDTKAVYAAMDELLRAGLPIASAEEEAEASPSSGQGESKPPLETS